MSPPECVEPCEESSLSVARRCFFLGGDDDEGVVSTKGSVSVSVAPKARARFAVGDRDGELAADDTSRLVGDGEPLSERRPGVKGFFQGDDGKDDDGACSTGAGRGAGVSLGCFLSGD